MHRLHPLTNLAIVGFCLVSGFTIPGMWSSHLIYWVLIAPLAAWSNVLRPIVISTFKFALPYALSLFIIRGLIWPGGTVILEIGPFSLKAEGLKFAVASTGRIIVIIGSFLLLTHTTRPDKLMLALIERGVPYSISYVVLTALQIVPRFQAKANTILDAQRSRGLETEGNLFVRFRALLPLIQPLLLGSIVDIEERAIALEVRAFSRRGPKTSLLVLQDTSPQRVVRILLLLASLAVIGWRIYLWLAPRLAA